MKIRSLLAVLAATVFMSESAFALSCARADIGQTMETAKSSDDLYYILVGTFTSKPIPKPQQKAVVDPRNQFETSKPKMVEAWFDGRILSNHKEFDTAVTRKPIDVEVTCAGPWCGSAPANGTEVIAFVKARPGLPMLLQAGPCPDKVFRLDRKKPQLKKLRACFDKTCAPDPKFDKL